MAEATDKEGLLRQNLYDAGCNNDMMEENTDTVKRATQEERRFL